MCRVGTLLNRRTIRGFVLGFDSSFPNPAGARPCQIYHLTSAQSQVWELWTANVV